MEAAPIMTMPFRKRSFFARLFSMMATAAMLAPLHGCMDFGGHDEPVTLETHVEDWRDEIIYQLLVDRFADGDWGNNYSLDPNHMARYHGGDWVGVEKRLDYLEALGVTTLWISPVVRNVETDAGVDGYHGYWTQDFLATNPHFGDLPALRSLVAAAHDREMKVIIDIVVNHVGQAFYYDINLNGVADERVEGGGAPGQSGVVNINEYDPEFDPRGIQSRTSLGEAGPAPVVFQYDPATNHLPPEPALFQDPAVYNRKGRTFNFDDPDQLLHGDFPGGLKDIDTTRCDVKNEMVEIYAQWIEWTDADGYRIDTVKHVEREFWRFFTQRLRQRLAEQGKTNFLMFGEVFDGNDELNGVFTKNDLPDAQTLAEEQACVPDGTPLTGDQLDSVFYFSQHFQAVRDVFQQAQSTQRIADLWSARSSRYGTEPAQGGIGVAPTDMPINFLDNHDVPRFLYGVATHPEDTRRALLHNALLFIFTAQGIPCLYYGTEQEFSGGNDPANREDMWPTGYPTDGATFKWIRKLADLRRDYQALRHGGFNVVWATEHTGDESDAGIFAFERIDGSNYALVLFNTNQTHESLPAFDGTAMQLSVPPGEVLVDVLSPQGFSYPVADDGSISIVLPPMTGAVLVPQTRA